MVRVGILSNGSVESGSASVSAAMLGRQGSGIMLETLGRMPRMPTMCILLILVGAVSFLGQ